MPQKMLTSCKEMFHVLAVEGVVKFTARLYITRNIWRKFSGSLLGHSLLYHTHHYDYHNSSSSSLSIIIISYHHGLHKYCEYIFIMKSVHFYKPEHLSFKQLSLVKIDL